MGAVAVEARAGELETAGFGEDREGLISNGGASCQLLWGGVGLGVCAGHTRVSESAAIKKIFVFIARNLRRARPAREQKNCRGSRVGCGHEIRTRHACLYKRRSTLT